jgi:excisionase family DNA binding protein
MSSAPTLLTTDEVAKLLHVHPKHVYRLLKKGLPALRVGSEWRFSREDVLAWSGAARVTQDPDEERAAVLPTAESPPSLVAANGDVVVHALLRLSADLGPPLLGLVPADMSGGLDLLRQSAVLAAGAHAGTFPCRVGSERVARVHLVEREIGLVYPRNSEAPGLSDLTHRRFASRPSSAGVRHWLDEKLQAAGLNPASAHARALILNSHLDVVLAVAEGVADVGLASRAWGERAGLAFHLLKREAYGLIVRARDLGDQRVVRLCEVAQGDQFQAEIGSIPGYDAIGAGDIRYDFGATQPAQ